MTKIELNKKYFKENKRVPTNKKVQYLIRYFKKYDKARLELQHASAMLTRAFDLERR